MGLVKRVAFFDKDVKYCLYGKKRKQDVSGQMDVEDLRQHVKLTAQIESAPHWVVVLTEKYVCLGECWC